MRDRQENLNSDPHLKDLEGQHRSPLDLREGLDLFRSSVRAAAERPEFFWKKQQAAITKRLQEPIPATRPRRTLAWASAGLAVLLCLFFFVQPSKAPTPDLPAGADQALLIEVEKALARECPEALMPVAPVSRETNSGQKTQ
jgi:hypothetical protein